MAQFYHLAASVGSGKTKAVFDYIRDNLDRGYLVVCPTVDLCNEAYRRLMLTLVNRREYSAGDKLRLVVEDKDLGSVFPRALNACRQFDQDVPPVVIITRVSFLYLCEALLDHEKAWFSVFIDEGMTPIEQVQFAPGNKDDFLRFLRVDEDGHSEAADGQKEILQWVAHNQQKLAARQLEHLCVPSFRDLCALVTSDNYDVFIETSAKTIQAIGVLSPRNLDAFIDVTMIVAAFETTLLPTLWKNRYGIDFAPWPKADGLFDTHVEKGPLMTIRYALHSGDLPSKRNLSRNYETGEQNEREPEKTVMYRNAEQVEMLFKDGAFCWAANKNFGNERTVLSGRRMPAMCAGLDDFKRFDAVVSLLVINPQPWVKNAVVRIFNLEDEEVYQRWRFAYTYQTVGRCSIRDRNSRRPIEVVVVSERCAKHLSELFEGSTVAGQCTDLPKLSKSGKAGRPLAGNIEYTRADNTAYSKYRKGMIGRDCKPLPKDRWFEEIRVHNIR